MLLWSSLVPHTRRRTTQGCKPGAEVRRQAQERKETIICGPTMVTRMEVLHNCGRVDSGFYSPEPYGSPPPFLQNLDPNPSSPQSIMDFLCLQRQAGETRLLGRDCERRSKTLRSNFHIQTRSNTDGSAQTESGGGDERGLEQGEETEVMTEPIVKVLLGTIKIEVEKKVSWWVEPYSTARRVWLGFYSGSISPCR
jgi:hypothetical protein